MVFVCSLGQNPQRVEERPALSSSAFAQTRDLGVEEANRKLVVEFYDRVFNEHETAEAAEVVADSYIQHNPNVPDGKEPFVSFFTGYFKTNPESRAKIVRSATDGDLVYLHVHSPKARRIVAWPSSTSSA